MSFPLLRPILIESAPLLWELADDEQTPPSLRIELGCTPRWYREAMGLDYRERWHRDPEYRRQSLVDMKKALNRRLPQLRLGGADPDQIPGTLSVAYGTILVAAIMGVPFEYAADNWPASPPGQLSDDEADHLVLPVLETSLVYQDLVRQMDLLEARWGQIHGVLNFQGVLNNAFRLRDDAIFTDMIAAPERAHHVLDVVTETMLNLIGAVHARQTASGVPREFFVTSNCVVNMISGAMYEEFVLPYDQQLRLHFKHFGIHNCGWNVNPYIDGYAQINDLAYLDFGLDSDLARIRDTFPNTRRCLIYSAVELADKSMAEIRRDLARIHDELAPCDILIGDIDAETPDERIMDFYQAAAKIWALEFESLWPDARNDRKI